MKLKRKKNWGKHQSYASLHFHSNAIPFLTFECFFSQFANNFLRFSFSLFVHLGEFRCVALLFIYLSQIWICMTHSAYFSFLHLARALSYYSIGHKATITAFFLSALCCSKLKWFQYFFLVCPFIRLFVCLFVWLVFHFMVHWWHSFLSSLHDRLTTNAHPKKENQERREKKKFRDC